MKRWLLLGFAALVALVGIVFSAINAAATELDLYFTTMRMPLGVLVLLFLVTGFLVGGIVVWAGQVVPLRLRLRQATKQKPAAPPLIVEPLPERR